MRTTRNISVSLAALLSAAALAGPAAAVPTDVVSGGSTAPPKPQPVVVEQSSGFDWSAAAIGAAGGVGAVAIALAGTAAMRRPPSTGTRH